MFSARLLAKNIVKTPVRNFGGAASASKNGYKEKTLVQIWCGDTGAYPVMGVIVGAAVFASSAALWFMFTSPDCRLSKADRKSLFRGELLSVDRMGDKAAHADKHGH